MDMTNVSEPLLSRCERNHAKEADRHEPKRYAVRLGSRNILPRRCCTVGGKAGSKSFGNGTRAECGKPNRSHMECGKRPARVRRRTSGYGMSEQAKVVL